MKIFIDFDDVIFNTKLFKCDFKNMFIEHGISSEIFDGCYNDPNDSRAIKTFDPWRQLELIEKNEPWVDKEKMNKLVNDFIADISAYVFDDVYNFVEIIGAENICIVSLGELEFQAKKICNSKIGKCIPDVFVTDSSKAETIFKIMQKEKDCSLSSCFFLDDRMEQLREVKERFPEITTIFVKRPEGRYQEMQKEKCCNYEVHNLEEALKIIRKEK